MYCPKCGEENPDTAKLCHACSWVLPSIPTTGSASGVKTSGWAVTSLILAILSLFTFFLTALPAVICGIVGLVKISGSQGQLKGRGFAIAGIALPGALLPVFVVMIGILMPALARVKAVREKMLCASNISALRTTIYLYANDFETYPPADKWCDLLIERTQAHHSIFRCKGASEGPCNYAMNKNAEGLGPDAPPNMVLLFETSPGWNQSGGLEMVNTDNHRGEGSNILFCDGHVEFVKTDNIKNLMWTKQ